LTSTRRLQTRQRAAVRAVLDDADGFASAQQLHAMLRERGDSVGLATVYRTLQQLAADEHVDVVRTGDGEAVYRRCSTARHHHHLICRGCRRTVEIDSIAVENWARTVAAENGFDDTEHVVEMVGTCADCAG
jgi:Fur family ferric uptake transcriptional regulator